MREKRELNYPLEAQLEEMEGDVLVGVFVLANGTPEKVEIFESSGFAALDTAAYQFAKNLEYESALLDQKPIDSWTRLLLRYQLSKVAFDPERWQRSVRRYQDQIASAADSLGALKFQRRLYMQYLGLVNYLERYNDMRVNPLVKDVVLSETYREWEAYWQEVPVAFVPFDDFLRRYPESPIQAKVKESLVRSLIEAESRLRVKSLKSAKISRRLLPLIHTIEARLDALQAELGNIEYTPSR